MELNRIMSHLVWLGTSALDLGAISMFWYCFRDRETILDLFEMSTGQRMHTRYIQVGGVIEDIPVGFEAKVREFAEQMPDRVDQFLALLAKNEIVLHRLRGVAAVDEQTLLDLGVTGPLLRATGNSWDLRKAAPYSGYENFDFKIPVGTTGDNWDRFAVRMRGDARSRCKIIQQALDGLPEGPYITENRKYALPPRHELATSMEALIHHFKLVTEGFRVPPGEAYYPIESPRGELGCFVRSDGSSKPARVHMRDPSFVNLQAFQADGAGPLHRRPDRDAGDARPDPRGDRPLMAIDPSQGQAVRARLARPRLGRGGRPHEGPGGRPRPGDDAGARRTSAREIEAQMAKYPDIRSAAIPALHIVQREHGWCSPTAIEQAACVMRLTPAYLTAVATFYDMFSTTPEGPPRRLRVHEHLVLAARRRRDLRRDAERRRRRPATST